MLAQETTGVSSDASVKVQGTGIANRDNVLATYTLGSTDPFMVDDIHRYAYYLRASNHPNSSIC